MTINSAISRFEEASTIHRTIYLLSLRHHSDPTFKAALEVFKPYIDKYVDETVQLGIHEYRAAKETSSGPTVG